MNTYDRGRRDALDFVRRLLSEDPVIANARGGTQTRAHISMRLREYETTVGLVTRENTVTHNECDACAGHGHFKPNGVPSIDRRDRTCLNCTGTGKVTRGATAK